MPDIQDDVMHQLMIQSTADLFAEPGATAHALRRQRQRRTRTRVLGVTVVAAAAGLAVGTLAISSGAASSAGTTHLAQLTSAQKTLYSLSDAAAGIHRPAGRYAVLTEKSFDIANGSRNDNEVGPKTSVIDTVTGGGVTYQDITVTGHHHSPQPPAALFAAAGTSPTTRQLDAMPTSPVELRAFLLAQAKQQLAQAYASEAQQAKKAGVKGQKAALAKVPQPTANDLVFEQATGTLWEPNLSPALRAALYKVLADTPGVRVRTGVTDSSGRPAVEISRVDTVSKTNVQTFENPKTGATLESAWIEPSGELLEDLYLSITYTNHIPANPYQG